MRMPIVHELSPGARPASAIPGGAALYGHPRRNKKLCRLVGATTAPTVSRLCRVIGVGAQCRVR